MTLERPHRIPAWSGDDTDRERLITREWLVTNGLGGYAAGSISGVVTRRYHGLLNAALPSPHGRIVMLTDVTEHLRLPTGKVVKLGGEETIGGRLELHGAPHLKEFRLEAGLPVWLYDLGGGYLVEKRVLLVHQQNTVHLAYRLLSGEGTVRLKLRPAMHFRRHEDPVSTPLRESYRLSATDFPEEDRYEIATSDGNGDRPPLRLRLCGERGAFTVEFRRLRERLYRLEESRGYDHTGELWSPGYFRIDLRTDSPASLVASTESWESIYAMTTAEALAAELERRYELLELADPSCRTGFAAELVLAADAFIITPAGRVEDATRSRAAGDEPRSVIAGYHWFTDWGRDTMISLEGLTLTTGRHLEAGYILRTFAHHVRDGLIPNMFPEGEIAGLYHTADATLWFFHAIHRYVQVTNDRTSLRRLLPTLKEIVEFHVRGTRFGIGIDPQDGLLRQGAEGYQLTWMDAKVDGWVVTPRRGKAVELNALWYNALRLLENWVREEEGDEAARPYAERAEYTRHNFNCRFWFEEEGHLYDVVDGEDGQDDPACRPNQVFAISLDHPVLDRERWEPVLQNVRERLLTPVGLRSLAPNHPEYKAKYYGDLRSRDAAYHQGTVWGWLIGPFVDAWMKLHPDKPEEVTRLLQGFVSHLDEACVGSISEVFDAETPFHPRGCVAQAWSVAEVLRCWAKLAR